MKHEGVLDTISATQQVPEIPIPTEEEHRGSCHSSRIAACSHSSTRDEDRFPCFIGKGIPTFPSHLKRPVSPENSSAYWGSSLHAKRPQCPHPHLMSLIPLHWLDCHPRIDSKHEGRCDSPVAPREKASNPYVKSTGSLTSLYTSRGKRSSMSPHQVRPDSLLKLHKKPEIHVSNGEEP